MTRSLPPSPFLNCVPDVRVTQGHHKINYLKRCRSPFGEKRLRGGRVWFRPGGLDCLGEALTVVPVCTWREMAVHGDLVTGSARAAATRRRWAPRSVSEA